MLLTPEQQKKFWRDWSAVVRQNHWTQEQAEAQRHALLQRAGFDSLRQVDRTDGYTAVLRELAAAREDLGALLHADAAANRKRILKYKILHLANKISLTKLTGTNNYLNALMLDKFGHLRLDDLTEPQMTQLRNTLAARATTKAKLLRTITNTPASPVPELITAQDPF
jgi:hypothetical protein